ncbi:hypothetical protein CC1G_13230 [Coprinopsis cinerea okayama7|uniref:Uncharacterized protein n=1 Tax=Coprinopsis cinerea (strain Okayama-7 / 130 / ATCC MYA-4618 / FGSC 9003) TaxID=240176 RepID=A8PI26_COPC7|nr:hypothetical protein CC1G_13230 [Coprinopsis cinerea okayama7\|eukprot:XP_001841503.1 hypothetical protein CC1G_13230 [Coprinopsis cinerea okayama7\
MKEIGGSLPGHKTWVAAPPFFPSLILLDLTLLPALVDVEASKKPLETKYKIRKHTMPPKAGLSTTRSTRRAPKTPEQKAREEEARKLRAEERDKAKQQKAAQQEGSKGGKGKGKGNKRKITSRAFIESDEEGDEADEPRPKKAKTTAVDGGSATSQVGDDEDRAADRGSAASQVGDDEDEAAARGSSRGPAGDDEDGAADGGSATSQAGDKEGGAADGGSAASQVGDDEDRVSGFHFV